MRRDSLVFAVSGVFFGFIVGWVLHDQYGRDSRPAAPLTAAEQPASSGESAVQRAAPPRVDEARARELRAAADRDGSDPKPRIELGNVYFDAERYDEAIQWYEAALALDPRNVNVSTDLGVSYYYTKQADRALQQFARSLKIDPSHTKTILNMGIVRAFGKQDLAGAAEAWQKVIALAPDSPEGRAAQQALTAMKSAHPGLTGGPPGGER